jgi:hypothetical protein
VLFIAFVPERLMMIKKTREFRPIFAVVEWILVGLSVVWFARFAYRSGGVVWGSDMLNYLEAGLGQIKDPFIVNRYTHVYALRLASIVAGNTLRGMHLYSGIAGGLTLLLVYFSARRLTRESTVLNGLIACLLLLTVPLLVRFILAPSVDTTLMVVVLAFIALYVQFTREGQSGPGLVVGMGILFILAIRTKEVAWVLLVLLPGLGMSSGGDFEWSSLRNRLRYFIVGSVIGIMVMMIANSVFVNTPLFGLRLSDITTHWDTWSEIIGKTTQTASTVYQLLLIDNGVLFVLFALAGLWFGQSIPKATRLLWLFPLLLMGFLMVATTRVEWTIVPRGFLSGLAAMSMLASNVFAVRFPLHRRSIQMSLVAVVIAIGFALYGQFTKSELLFARYFELALVPVLLGLVLVLMIFFQDREQSGWATFVLLLALTGYSAWLNLSSVASEIEASGYRSRFAMPLALQNRIDISSPFDAYVSRSALAGLRGVANSDELAGIFNVALDGQTVYTDYQIGVVGEPLILAMEGSDYKYVIVTPSEWDWLRTAPQDRPQWRGKYKAFEEPSGRYVLLTLKKESDSS